MSIIITVNGRISLCVHFGFIWIRQNQTFFLGQFLILKLFIHRNATMKFLIHQNKQQWKSPVAIWVDIVIFHFSQLQWKMSSIQSILHGYSKCSFLFLFDDQMQSILINVFYLDPRWLCWWLRDVFVWFLPIYLSASLWMSPWFSLFGLITSLLSQYIMLALTCLDAINIIKLIMCEYMHVAHWMSLIYPLIME